MTTQETHDTTSYSTSGDRESLRIKNDRKTEDKTVVENGQTFETIASFIIKDDAGNTLESGGVSAKNWTETKTHEFVADYSSSHTVNEDGLATCPSRKPHAISQAKFGWLYWSTESCINGCTRNLR